MKNKKDITKTEILEAAEKVFQKWGLNKITMEDIAEASGRCKGSLYYYYKDKEEIMKIDHSHDGSRSISVGIRSFSEKFSECEHRCRGRRISVHCSPTREGRT